MLRAGDAITVDEGHESSSILAAIVGLRPDPAERELSLRVLRNSEHLEIAVPSSALRLLLSSGIIQIIPDFGGQD